MSDEYPLYPTLPEEAQKEAQALINKFKHDLTKAADEAISHLYCDVLPYIESDTWSNFRNEIILGFRDYGNRKFQSEYDFREIRRAIYKNHKKEIIDDLNQDLVKENALLIEQIRIFREEF